MQVRDLLAFEENLTDMELQKTATGFALPGLTKVPVTSAEQITEVMSRGYENRCTAAHDINAHSSRSHALLIVEVAATNLGSGIRTVGKLTLCDLAGRYAAPRPPLHYLSRERQRVPGLPPVGCYTSPGVVVGSCLLFLATTQLCRCSPGVLLTPRHALRMFPADT